MTRWIRFLALGCPVCGRRRRHLVFCRWRPPPLPPLQLALLLVAPFWIGTYLAAGWAGIGFMLIVCGLAELAIFALPVWLERARRRHAARTAPRDEEIVGVLYAEELIHEAAMQRVRELIDDPAFRAELEADRL
jgi:hypothetical protein